MKFLQHPLPLLLLHIIDGTKTLELRLTEMPISPSKYQIAGFEPGNLPEDGEGPAVAARGFHKVHELRLKVSDGGA
ncbi:hypothetical protein IEQ34_007337 [Dendrobium chrysotoxum]|uniref:ASCH domain-containing protein n=1 Tax=Dendrobium chrysotoxum TaxID=161865 RepID=A0AAV7H608_DENCH|nr:hypothetical protein IEQ34_007337 [Dendrobium chrysotoxum]